MRVLFLALLMGGMSVLPSSAQTLWSRPYEPNQLSIEAIVPNAADDAAPLSGATFITSTLSLTDNVELTAELPMARYKPSENGARATTAIGNPFVGLGLSSTTVPFLLQIGTRIPAAPSNSAIPIGADADVGRTPAFRPDEFAVSALLNTRFELSRFTTLRFRSGIEFGTRPTPNNSSRIQTWRMPYEAQLWREGDSFITGLTFAGRALLSSPGTTQHHAALSIMRNWNLVQPGLLVGTSLNDLFRDGEFVPFAGLTLSISYGRL